MRLRGRRCAKIFPGFRRTLKDDAAFSLAKRKSVNFDSDNFGVPHPILRLSLINISRL